MNVPTTEPEGLPLDILLEDGPVLAVNKPGGLLTLGAGLGIPTLERRVKAYLKERYEKAGNVYLGIPHRLDRPVSGVMVFARNSKAAARLAEQFRERQVQKTYWAAVEKPMESAEGVLVDWLKKTPEVAQVGIVPPETAGAREARLRYRTIGNDGRFLEIELLTGRMHQIRVQLASRGHTVVGDVQYGAKEPLNFGGSTDARDWPIALHARELTLLHPVRYDRVSITAPLPSWWDLFPGVRGA